MKNVRFTQEGIRALSPKVRDLVIWLNEREFQTTDSGDGSSFEQGMEGALPFPMISIVCGALEMIDTSNRLYRLLEERGVDFAPTFSDYPQIQATYDPRVPIGIVTICNVTSDMVDMHDKNACRK
jgi:hypothetical protein